MAKARRQESPPPPARAAVLVVEDERDIQELLQYNLTRNGFAVTCASTGEEGLKAARAKAPDLILLDLMLPGMDGLELCRALKSDPTTASALIVMVTAKGEESDVVTGLELGAEDYIIKPFSPRVLIARVRAVLRRRAAGDQTSDDDVLHVGSIAVDPTRHEVRVGDEPLTLTHTEFLIVQLLARRPGRVFTRGQIVHNVQGDMAAVTDRSVDVHIVSLRRKLGNAADLLQTVRGVGYRLEEP
jgi:two-component system, OmpR family, alkaline phosphatase synthesis response regulator PhoP